MPIPFRKKILKYRKWQDAQASLLGKCLLTSAVLDGDFDRLRDIQFNEYGKPSIPGEFFFNISHSRNVVLIAYGNVQLGIDIEKKEDIQIEDFKTQMTQKEWDSVHSVPHKIEAFYEYWTQKESAIKYVGKGLSIPLKSFEIIKGTHTIIENDLLFFKKIFIDEDYVCNMASKENFNDTQVKIQQIEYSL
ncbi:4'-phosphopantetheinyl transferase family protein [Chryseobacterium pennae]|nr:4'-phosphopantetheinyl transferase superfamily protein [Chryseobacterium pennae]